MLTKMPSKFEYDDLIEKLSNCVKFYKNNDYKYSVLKCYLSNGTIITFDFKKQHIPHLLGINIASLKSRKILSNTAPFEMLEELIERSSYIYTKCKNGELNFFDIFSNYMEEKMDSFEQILRFNIKDICFVSEYDKKRAYTNGEPNNYGCNYYICFKNDEDNYAFLGLKKDEFTSKYSPSSILAFKEESTCEKELTELIGNQNVTILNQIKNLNNYYDTYAGNEEKLLLVQNLVNLRSKYGFTIDLSKEYLYFIHKFIEINDIVSDITSAMFKGKKVSKETISKAEGTSNKCSTLVSAYNLAVEKTIKTGISSELDELNKLKAELEELKRIKEQNEQAILRQKELLSKQEETLKNQDKQIKRLSLFKQRFDSLANEFKETE